MTEENGRLPNKKLSLGQINNWKMRTKLLALGLFVAVVSVMALTLFSLNRVNQHTIETIGTGLQREGYGLAEQIDSVIEGSVQDLETLALSPSLIAAVETANQTYVDRDPVELNTEIAQMDTAWANGDPSIDGLVAQIAGNDLSSHLQSFQSRFSEQMETFVTDIEGLNVGMTDRTGDYLQADEEWWLRTYNNGLGAIFIGDVSYDDTAQAFGMDIGVPVRDRQGQEVIGVLRGTVDVTVAFQELSAVSIGETGRAVLLDGDGRFLYTDDTEQFMQMAPDGILALFENSQEAWYDNQIAPDGHPAVISTSLVPGDVGEQLGWTLMLYQDLEEIKSGVSQDYLMATLFAAAVIIFLVTILSLFFARTITQPLDIIVQGAKLLSNGDVSRNGVDETAAFKLAARRDELGDITRAFFKLEEFFKAKADAATAIAQGNLAVAVPVASDADTLGNAMKLMKERVTQAIDAIGRIVDAAVAGNLSTRVDVSQYEGDYARIVSGMNATLDAIITPLNVAVMALNKFSAGQQPDEIVDHFAGDYAQIKDSVNTLTEIVKMRGLDVQFLLDAASNGQLDERVDASRYAGANGSLLKGINQILDATAAPMRDTGRILAQVAQGNLTVSMNGGYHGDYAVLTNSTNEMITGLRNMAEQMQEGAVNITSATAEILASSSQMASTTQEQASAVNQITSTVEEIKASAEQVAQRAQGVADAASEAARAAQRGSDAAEETIDGMDDIRQKVESIAENILSLSEQMQQIGDIIDTVTDIADQSNILALNAAIEAAQAGEAGKGFRVVADEVRSLAEQSRQAAGQVKIILGDIQKATNLAVMATEQGTKGVDAGTAMVNRTAQTIRELAGTVDASAQAAQQIVAGVQQQTVGLDQIAIGMGDINMATQQTAAGAQQSQKAAEDLNTLADQLKMVVSQYKL
ncbi:MAG: hypothetical protein H6667_11035 [Ardenticatenaceae bacterium]|nr:hypothetical protein [Ardenticatenaceae bacterium]MCB9444362.1 hypothetical protein [Ardenticatenaceae bacterium]